MCLYEELTWTDEERSSSRLRKLFHDITLSLGGVFYAYPVPDEAVWEIVRSLDRIFRHALNTKDSSDSANSEPPKHSRGRRHPAVVELLRKLDGYGLANMNQPAEVFNDV